MLMPLSVKRQPRQLTSADVVVVGGGLAALSAAISASDAGASVVLVNKGVTGQAGSSAKAAGILAAAFGDGDLHLRPVPDSPAKHAADTLAVGYHVGDPSLVRHVTDNARTAVRWLEDLGILFSRADDGGYIQLNAPGNSCPRAVSALGGGKAIMDRLVAQARQRGIVILDRVIARQILLDQGRVAGIHIQGDSHAVIHSPAVILAAGGATGLFPSVSGDANNFGSSLMLGYDAGARLGNLEFIEFTLIYRVHGQILRIAGMAPFLSRGARLLNSAGDDLLAQHFPQTPTAQIGRAEILRMVEGEIRAGRAPVVLDCTGFSDSLWAEFEASQGSTTLDKIAAAGCDYRREMIEVLPAAHSVLAGLMIETSGKTSIDGLFAAGENATGIHGAGRLSGNGLTACVVMGQSAGTAAAGLSPAGKTPISAADQAALQTLSLPSSVTMPAPFATMLSGLRQIVGDSLGIIRNDADLKAAQKEFDAIAVEIMAADDGSIAAFELGQMARLASLMTAAAIARTESRGVQFRLDHQSLAQGWARAQTLTKPRA